MNLKHLSICVRVALLILQTYFLVQSLQPFLFWTQLDLQFARFTQKPNTRDSAYDRAVDTISSLLINEKWADEAFQLAQVRSYSSVGVMCSVIRSLNPACKGNFDGAYAGAYLDCYTRAMNSREYRYKPWETCLAEKVLAYDQLTAAETADGFRDSIEIAKEILCCTQLPTEEEITEKWGNICMHKAETAM
jgi:hypothetical protein